MNGARLFAYSSLLFASGFFAGTWQPVAEAQSNSILRTTTIGTPSTDGPFPGPTQDPMQPPMPRLGGPFYPFGMSGTASQMPQPCATKADVMAALVEVKRSTEASTGNKNGRGPGGDMRSPVSGARANSDPRDAEGNPFAIGSSKFINNQLKTVDDFLKEDAAESQQKNKEKEEQEKKGKSGS